MPQNLRIHITLAGLANELQEERGLSASYIGNPSSGPQLRF